MISSQDYIRLRTTTKDTRRPHKIAKKTQTYLDKLRQRNVVVTPSTTTQASTTLAILQDDYHGESGKDHPTAHLRPLNDEIENPPEEPKSGNIGSDRSNIRGVQLVTPVYGEFTPSPYDIESNRKLNFSRLVFTYQNSIKW